MVAEVSLHPEMGTLSDGHGPLLVHSSKLLPLIVALEILYTWDGDYALVRPLYDTERSQWLLRTWGLETMHW